MTGIGGATRVQTWLRSLPHHLRPEMSDFLLPSWHGLKACKEATPWFSSSQNGRRGEVGAAIAQRQGPA
jgi:hypothetical protein